MVLPAPPQLPLRRASGVGVGGVAIAVVAFDAVAVRVPREVSPYLDQGFAEGSFSPGVGHHNAARLRLRYLEAVDVRFTEFQDEGYDGGVGRGASAAVPPRPEARAG